MKKYTIFLMLFLLQAMKCEAAPNKIKIGVSVPLSGDAASYGNDIKNSLLFANKELSDNNYELVFEDDRCDGKQSASIAHKFVSNKVRYVLGFACSGSLLSSAPIYEKNKIIVISAGASSPTVSTAGDFIFRTAPSDVSSLAVLVDYLVAHHKKITFLADESDYSEGMVKGVQSFAGEKLSINVERFLPTESDFNSLLLRIKSANPEALMLVTQAEGKLADIAKAIRVLNWSIHVYGAYFPGSPSFLNTAGEAANGIKYLDAPLVSEVASSKGLELYQKFISEYGTPKSIPYFFVTAYNSFDALDLAIKSGKDVKNTLYELKVDGITGTFYFDHNGDVMGLKNVMKIIEGGKPKLLG